ncbi:hypothetical protein B296_00031189 [Ensete ventricosum]|uniref:Uncharacterized protein n=1 Tax=Ensete ventricosum TaxID=4639 RepID=A0A426YAT9_ENSVE|nr:hypothetical protein B296_00031189 [Ensete ventricosum]
MHAIATAIAGKHRFCARQPSPLLAGGRTTTAYTRLLLAYERRLSAASARRWSPLCSGVATIGLLFARNRCATTTCARSPLAAHSRCRYAAVLLMQPSYPMILHSRNRQ